MFECAVALVLLVDVSNSVTRDHYEMQRDGIAAAFSNSQIQDAIEKQRGGVAITVIEWSSSQTTTIPWTVVKNRSDSSRLSHEISITTRSEKLNTAIGDAMNAGIQAFNYVPCDPRSKIIDISGDGRNNMGLLPEVVRRVAENEDIIVNGLAIVTEDDPTIYEYYKENVITSQGFVVKANGFNEFIRTIRSKILVEVSMLFKF